MQMNDGETSDGKRCFRTYTANANGSYNAGVLCNTTNSSGQSRYAETYLIADINNDGRDDYIALWKNDNDEINLYTYLGTAQGTFTAAVVSYHNTKISHFNY